MIECRIKLIEHGRLVPATRTDFERLSSAFDVGTVLNAKLTKRRSVPQNSYFHAVVRRAFANRVGGPSAELCPTEEHLKHWLLIEAGHCSVDQFEPEAMTPAVAAWMRRRDPTVQFFISGHRIYARTALSIAFRACGPQVFGDVVNRVLDIIVDTIVPGSTREEWEPQHFDARYGAADWAQDLRARAAARRSTQRTDGNVASEVAA